MGFAGEKVPIAGLKKYDDIFLHLFFCEPNYLENYLRKFSMIVFFSNLKKIIDFLNFSFVFSMKFYFVGHHIFLPTLEFLIVSLRNMTSSYIQSSINANLFFSLLFFLNCMCLNYILVKYLVHFTSHNFL